MAPGLLSESPQISSAPCEFLLVFPFSFIWIANYSSRSWIRERIFCSNEGRRYRLPPNSPARFHPSDIIEFGSDKKVIYIKQSLLSIWNPFYIQPFLYYLSSNCLILHKNCYYCTFYPYCRLPSGWRWWKVHQKMRKKCKGINYFRQYKQSSPMWLLNLYCNPQKKIIVQHLLLAA